MKKVAPGQKYIQGKKLLEMDQKSWVEVTLDYEPTEEDLNPGENVTLDGLLVVEEMWVVHVALDPPYKGAIPLVDFDSQDAGDYETQPEIFSNSQVKAGNSSLAEYLVYESEKCAMAVIV
ncbi:hypothetical protein E5288_WYG003781 [Bos mutus]|uniref:Uncharacterized protein n=1 Tax=Bos mutus TaxID=72004 RepID=A0A6B0RMJ0_9CETA|nr:hypothetical protein [Bos mutus]